MFDRFDIGREAYPESETTYPSFEKPKDWYDLKVLAKEHKPLDEINYSTHRNAMNKAYEAPGMSFKASTHAMRGSAARMADLQGASKESIRRAGRWNTEAMESCYLTTLPIETIRAHAGFNPKGADFFLPGVQAPEALKKKVFPFASEELARVRNRSHSERNLAATAFLSLLVELREVFLQDAVLMKQHHLLNSLPQLTLGLAYGGETDSATPIITQTFIATLAPTEVYVHLRFHLMPNASRHACCSR